MTNVTQEDRDAAEKLVLNTPRFLTGITRDHRALTESLARHRIAAEAKERERIVAWLRDCTFEAQDLEWMGPLDIADTIERGDHMEDRQADAHRREVAIDS